MYSKADTSTLSDIHRHSRHMPEWFPISLILFLIALIRSVQTFFFLFTGERTLANYLTVLASNLAYFLYFVPLSIIARLCTKKFPFRETKTSVLIGTHLSVVIASFFIHQTFMLGIDQLLWQPEWHPSLLFYRFFNNPAVWIELIVYGLFILGFYLQEYQIHIQKREGEAKRLEAELMNSRVQEVKNRLHPRLLFSTLETIKNFIHAGRYQQANSLLSVLSDYLRITVYSSTNEWATLEEELTFLRLYLEIESARINKPLKLIEHGVKQRRSLLLPKFTLQPLVDHALRLTNRPQSLSHLELRASTDETSVFLSLHIPAHLPASRQENAHNENTFEVISKRLSMLYKSNIEIQIQHENKTNTRITFNIPLNTPVSETLTETLA